MEEVIILRRFRNHRLALGLRRSDGSKVVIEDHDFVIVHDYAWRLSDRPGKIMDRLYPPD